MKYLLGLLVVSLMLSFQVSACVLDIHCSTLDCPEDKLYFDIEGGFGVYIMDQSKKVTEIDCGPESGTYPPYSPCDVSSLDDETTYYVTYTESDYVCGDINGNLGKDIKGAMLISW